MNRKERWLRLVWLRLRLNLRLCLRRRMTNTCIHCRARATR
nr:MAG TPA: hypothetical protein [Caudoviricetes sp.]